MKEISVADMWTDSTMQSNSGLNVKVWYPVKYKTGRSNSVTGAPSPEYSMVLRLAEMYLIRAEARANGADGGHTKAIEDLNAIRFQNRTARSFHGPRCQCRKSGCP